MNVAVVYEGVLIKTDGTNAPIQEGVDMVRGLAAVGRVVVLSEAAEATVERFLGVHRIDGVAEILSGSERPGDEPLTVRQVEQHRAGGQRLDAVVLSDPQLLSWALEVRLAAVLFLAPWSIPPKFRPDDDAGRPTWDEIEASLDKRENVAP